MTSCQNKEEAEVTPEVQMQEFIISATQTSNTIELSWQNVEGVSWYHLNYGKSTTDKSLSTSFPNSNMADMTYMLSGLTPNTEYEISLDGTTLSTGGDMVAKSNTIKVTTSRMTTTTPDEVESTSVHKTDGM